jgi:hypothetical protein
LAANLLCFRQIWLSRFNFWENGTLSRQLLLRSSGLAQTTAASLASLTHSQGRTALGLWSRRSEATIILW